MRGRCSTILLLLLGATSSHASHGFDRDGLLWADRGEAARPAPADAQAVQVQPAPLPAGAVQIDSTWYDLQDFGSLGTRIVIGADGRVHVAWQDDFCELDPVNGCPPNLNAPQPYPRRGMGYAFRSAAGLWTRLGKVEDPDIPNCCPLDEHLGGFGTLAITPAGRAVVSQHLNEDGCQLYRSNLYLQDSPGAATYAAYLTQVATGPSYLFPQVVALPNGSFVMLAEAPHDGCYDQIEVMRISRLTAAGTLYTCNNPQMGPWIQPASTSIYPDGKPGFPCLAASSNGRVGIAVTDFGDRGGGLGGDCTRTQPTYGGNVWLIESSDGTFNTSTVTIRNLTNYVDATIIAGDSTSTQYRPWIHCHLAYNDTTPNVVWSELQARRVGAAIKHFDHRSRIRHWDPVRGVSTVKQVAPGEADTFDNVDYGLSGPISGFNTISVDWPQVGFSADGRETYVAWLRFVDSQVDPTADAGQPGFVTGIGFGDIACSLTRPGESWQPPQNLTQTPITDERFFSLAARNPGGMAHIVFQASATNQAGVVQALDRGPSTAANYLRRIAYLERALSGALAVGDEPPASSPRLGVFPNPARGGHAKFSLGSSGGGTVIEVLSVGGRLMARVPLGPDGRADWDGRDRLGRASPSGVYFARVEGRADFSIKFLLLH